MVRQSNCYPVRSDPRAACTLRGVHQHLLLHQVTVLRKRLQQLPDARRRGHRGRGRQVPQAGELPIGRGALQEAVQIIITTTTTTITTTDYN